MVCYLDRTTYDLLRGWCSPAPEKLQWFRKKHGCSTFGCLVRGHVSCRPDVKCSLTNARSAWKTVGAFETPPLTAKVGRGPFISGRSLVSYSGPGHESLPDSLRSRIRTGLKILQARACNPPTTWGRMSKLKDVTPLDSEATNYCSVYSESPHMF